MASDGFFPFPDGVEVAAAAGVTAIIAPAGSLKDADVIIRANELELERMGSAGEVNPQKEAALTAAVAAATQEHKNLADYLEEAIDYEVVPIRKLVYIQLCCGLHMAEYLKVHPEKRVSV